MRPASRHLYDVVIVGGGASGLSAAQTLARARRSVAVVDSGEPRNAPAKGVHAFISRDGVSPLELLRISRTEAESYGAVLFAGQVVEASGTEGSFALTLHDGVQVAGRRILVATGVRDELPPIPGLPGLWGKDVLHCPYCHGWEVRDQAIGIIGTGPGSAHQALMFRQWSSDITLFLNDSAEPGDEELEQLHARGISIVDGAVRELRLHDGRLRSVALPSGEVAVDAVVVSPTTHARLDGLAGLGLAPTAHPCGMGDYLETDANGATPVAGVWAAGNIADSSAQVLAAAASGVWAAVQINHNLMEEDVAKDVAAHRDSLGLRA